MALNVKLGLWGGQVCRATPTCIRRVSFKRTFQANVY